MEQIAQVHSFIQVITFCPKVKKMGEFYELDVYKGWSERKSQLANLNRDASGRR